ncbi:MAG: proline--tRNA ligase [Chromatiales bacterium]|jgi:prolyl-tRNA synthetase|nr:proline--tRNA ligase [Chromatiales bacterium]MDP6150228.1 proline--tRNA ligase [Gammaproteobacteria bacterium]MDP7093202.1 proline--tRNA ligase [Gammaproteobacteria bacterium]MDP7271555.1 proline--tRNA ligase [Gammaproteobacteria bacterium]HJP04887.1 proline--tRNA ligase [Gammaproteobacteria bacterium]
MRLSKLPLTTFKEVPADAEIASHQLMLRAGLIRQLASGLFTWMPIGLRVLRKVEQVVREEMDRAGAMELLMPAVQPAELWQETGRWEKYGPLLLRMHDRKNREFCFGPTHEEVITDIGRQELKSYKQLPVNYYQIQTKFRDELRPRFGLMRAREFVMKDAYSFHLDQDSLDETYALMESTYQLIFKRLGLPCKSVDADSGAIGGARSCEFHVLAESGEDALAYVDGEDFAMNVELAPAAAPDEPRANATKEMQKVETPDSRSIDQVCDKLATVPSQTVKTLLVEGEKNDLIALVLRGDHSLNSSKAEKLDGVRQPLTLADAEQIESVLGAEPGFVGPVGTKIRVVADYSAAACADFVCGANENGRHLTGVNWGRDLPEPETADLRNVVTGDKSPAGGMISIARGIEVGHIFQLGDTYSKRMNARVLDKDGREQPMLMGCYGIGVSRIVAASVEQNHDEKGIVWPSRLAPFQVALLALNAKKSAEVRSFAESLYEKFTQAGIEVLFDDRDARPGVMFADADLLGIPHQVVVGDRGLGNGIVEYRQRCSGDSREMELDGIVDYITTQIDSKD